MTNEQFLKKIEEILPKAGFDEEIVSDDPDMDFDYGVDENGRVVMIERSTFIAVKDVIAVKYRPATDQRDGYIRFILRNDMEVKTYFDYYDKAFTRIALKTLNVDTKLWISEAERILFNSKWNIEDEFCIEKDELLLFNGRSSDVSVPEGVERIGKNSFMNNKFVETIVLPSSCKVIDHDAFHHAYSLRNVFIKSTREKVLDGQSDVVIKYI